MIVRAATLEVAPAHVRRRSVLLPRLDQLWTTALSLMATIATNSALGVVFWAIAGNTSTPRALGEDAGVISAAMLLSIVSQLNLGMTIPRLLPQIATRRWRPVVAAYAASAAVAVVATAAFVTVAPRVAPGFAFMRGDAALAWALIGAVVVWNVFALQDAALTAVRWAPVVPIENAFFGLLKIALLVVLARRFGVHGVFAAWLVAMVLTVAPVNVLLFGKALRRSSSAPARSVLLPLTDRPRIARYMATDYVAALLSQGYNAFLPLLVTALLGGEANAYFYVAFLVAAAVGALTHSLSTSLVVECAHEESNLLPHARRTLLRYAAVVAPGVALLIAGAGPVLAFFGDAYVEHGRTLLRLLLAGTIPQSLVTIYLGIERVRARVDRVLAIEAATVVFMTVGAVIGMQFLGVTGVGLAWLLVHAAMAACIVPALRRATTGEARSAAGAI